MTCINQGIIAETPSYIVRLYFSGDNEVERGVILRSYEWDVLRNHQGSYGQRMYSPTLFSVISQVA